MATTEYGVNHPLAVKRWSKGLMKETLKNTHVMQFMGTGPNNICQIKTELGKEEGDKVTFGLRLQLSGDGVAGDSNLEGNEEALTTYNDSVVIDQLRHAVRSKGKMSEQRIPFSVREEAMMGLRDWWADRIDTSFFNQLAGNSGQSDTRYTGMQAAIAPTAETTVLVNGHTTEASLTATASAQFSLELIDQAALKARTMTPIIRPLKTGVKNVKYCMFITPEMHYDLRRNTNTLQWGDIQKAAMQGGQISDNPIFTGALGLYNGVLLHEAYRLPRFTSTGGSTTGRAVLAGAQGGLMAFGQGHGKSKFDWNEELFDYGNQLGVEAGSIFGMKKTRYNSADFGVVTVMAAHSTEAENANGR